MDKVKQKTGVGFELSVTWLPGTVKRRNGKRLAEEVIGNNLFIYAENPKEALRLVNHSFFEWMLNQHTQPYRRLINKLITLFEELQYQRKEKIIESLTNLVTSEARPDGSSKSGVGYKKGEVSNGP